MSTSWPERMPPSIQTSICEPTASTIAGSALIDDGAPSSWRPPWLETISASAPLSTASRASSTSRMPFRISLPPQRFLIHSTSSQFRRGSNCSRRPGDERRHVADALDVADDVAEAAPLRAEHAQAPARLGHQVEQVGERRLGRRGQAVLQVLVALAEDLQVEREHQRAAVGRLGAVDQPLDEVAVAHHVELEPERRLGVRGDVLDRADAHRRQRERDAELLGRARREDLAVGVLHAGQAGRRDRHRHRDRPGRPSSCAMRAVLHVDRDALAQLDASGSRPRWRGRCSRSTSRSRRSRRTCAARAASRARAGLRCW